MVTLVNRAKVGTTTTGTGTITLGPAKSGYRTLADAGVLNANVVRYVIEDGSNFEIGTGVYTASGTTLSRTVTESSNSDAALNLSGNATVFVGATAEDLGTTWVRKTTTYTAAVNDAIIADTSGGVWTLTLPAGPALGAYIRILDGANLATNNLTVSRNGQTIQGDAEDLVINIGGVSVDLVFDGTTWQVTAQVGGQGGDAVSLTGTQTLTNKTLTSPIFTGTPTAPTATVGTNTTQIASTAFVLANGSSSSVAALTPAATVDISLASADYFTITLDQNTTFTVSNVDAGVDTFNLTITGFAVEGDGYYLPQASYDSVSFSVASQDSIPEGIFFKPDGTKMYVLGRANTTVFQFSLSTAWDLSTASYDSVSFSVGSQDSSPAELFFKPDGTKMYVVGYGDFPNSYVYQYSLSTAWDLSTASYDNVSFEVSSQEQIPFVMFFKPDGTKMYIAGDGATVYQYSLSTAWDLSTASYDSVSFSVNSQEGSPNSISFKPDGTKMYVLGTSTDAVLQFSLSTAWVVSSASYDSVSFSVGSQESTPQGMFFKSDGKKLYVVGLNTDTVYQYSTVAFVTSTATYPESFKFPAGTTPTVPANGEVNILEAQTTDGGNTFNVRQLGADFS